MGYSVELKIRAVKYHMGGKTVLETAETFGVGKSSVSLWANEFRNTGSISERKIQERDHLRKITPEKIEEFLTNNPTGNMAEMAKVFECTPQSVAVAIKKFGFSKKNSESCIKKLAKF